MVETGSAAALRVLDPERATRVRALCELLVPGCARTGAEVYLDALLARMDDTSRTGALEALDTLADVVAAGAPTGMSGVQALAAHALTPEFGLVRALACEAYYSDFVADGAPGPGAWAEIGFAPPLATRLAKDWSYLGIGG